MGTKWILIGIALITVTSLVIQSQSYDIPSECAMPTSWELDNVSENLRILVDRENQSNLVLLNPITNTHIKLDETSYINRVTGEETSTGLPLMFNNAQDILLIRGTLWQTMNITGANRNVVKDTDTVFRPNFHLTDDGRLLFMDDSTREFTLMNLNTGHLNNFYFEQLFDFIPYDAGNSNDALVPLSYEFSPSLDYIAYWAYQVDGESIGKVNEVIRIQDLNDNTYFDISAEMIGVNQIQKAFWSWYSDNLLWLADVNGIHEQIYDVINQRRIYSIESPNSDWIRGASHLSPDGNRLAQTYAIQTDGSPYVLIIRDIDNSYFRCFQLQIRPTYILDNLCGFCGEQIIWTPNSQYLWWFECKSELQFMLQCNGSYNLMLLDVDTNQYGILLSDVGLNTRIGFVNNK